jgi:hypothetical protein
MKSKLRIEDYEYSSTAALAAEQRAVAPRAANAAVEARNRQHGQRMARELSAAQAKARQPIEDEAELARALLQLQATTGVQVGIERHRKRQK